MTAWLDVADRGKPSSAPAGRVICREGEPAGSAYLITDGRWKITVSAASGADLAVNFKGRGDLVGEFAALDGGERSATVTVAEDSTYVVFTRDVFRRLLLDHPPLAMDLLERLGRQLRLLTRRTAVRDGLDVNARLCARLEDLMELLGEHGALIETDQGGVVLSVSQDELAGWIGATRESTARSLGELRRAGVLDTGRRRIEVLDRAELHRIGLGA